MEEAGDKNTAHQPGKHMKIMERKASDNKYLHKDFHISMNILLKYIYGNFGKKQLIKYLEQYAKAYYKPINDELKSGRLDALANYFNDIYEKEEWDVTIQSNDDFIEIRQDACPGISHIRANGGLPCPCYQETYNTVYAELCKGTPFRYELKYFDKETGACKQIFRRAGK